MMASGAAAMGYEIVWTQQSSLWLGHESAAVLAVVAAFFGGLALGGLTLGARVETSSRPARWYAGCELVIALWSLILLGAASPFSGWILRAIGAQPSAIWQWTVTFGSTFLLFLPATAAMGATLPAMERITAELRDQGRSIAALYASNTSGSVLGVLVAAFWLIPGIGLARSAMICIALNLLCGAIALTVFPRTIPPPAASPLDRTLDRTRARRVLTLLALTGFLGISYEVLAVRVLGQVTEDTVYTFAMLLGVYLAGSAAGAAGYQRWLRDRDPGSLGDRLFAALAAACLLGTASLWAAECIKMWALSIFGTGFGSALAAEAWLAVLAFGPPTIAMGAVFSHLSRSASQAGLSFGRAVGVNLLAAAAAPVVCGVAAIPALGPKRVLLLTAVAYLAGATPRAWTRPMLWLPALGALALALFAPPLRFVDVPDGGRVVSYQDGAMASVSVVEDAGGALRLRIDNRQQEGTSATRRVDARLAWLPLLLHPSPRRALFLGLGTGVTAWAAAEDPTLDVDVVELLPEVIAASTHFTGTSATSTTRPRVMAADARRYVRATDRSYDLIVADNFHPARSGSAALYTVEHFAAVRERLEPSGVFCQWLPVHQLDLPSLRSIVRSFATVYPISWAILANNSLDTPVLGLVARRDQRRFDLPSLREHVARARPERLAELGLDDELAILGSAIAGPGALSRFAAGAAANTDDHPIVAYTAPRATYAPDSPPRDRLIALLRQLSIEPDELVVPDPASQRLAAYWTARNRFVESGREVRPSADVNEMLAQVREPLLSVLRISPDFRPAYDPLLSMAMALARSDVAGARMLLGELTRVQPARPEAIRMLASLSGEPAVRPAAP
jgi:spermidine synthase